jgi:hypothetical protein
MTPATCPYTPFLIVEGNKRIPNPLAEAWHNGHQAALDSVMEEVTKGWPESGIREITK